MKQRESSRYVQFNIFYQNHSRYIIIFYSYLKPFSRTTRDLQTKLHISSNIAFKYYSFRLTGKIVMLSLIIFHSAVNKQVPQYVEVNNFFYKCNVFLTFTLWYLPHLRFVTPSIVINYYYYIDINQLARKLQKIGNCFLKRLQ